MSKEETFENDNKSEEVESDIDKNDTSQNAAEEKNQNTLKEISLDDKIKELEEKIVRLYAEMENQRRRYDKEKDEALNMEVFHLQKKHLIY